MPGHPENAARIAKAMKTFKHELAKNGEQYLTKIHTQRYIDRVKKASAEAGRGFKFLDAGETYACAETYKAACYAVGAAVAAAEYARKKKNAFALVRPPGHHAHPDWTNGFCVFNNIAIASAYLAEKDERVLILDIDLHRGDGTSDCVTRLNQEMENRLYYFSINQHGIFPGASIDEGNVHNIYLDFGTSEDEYITVLKKEVPALMSRFKPTIVAISAGFDSFAKDKETHSATLGCGLSLTKKTVIELKKMLEKIPYFAVLEGGYNPDSVVEGVGAFLGINVPEPKKKEAKAIKKIAVKKKSVQKIITKKPSAKTRHKKIPLTKANMKAAKKTKRKK